MKVLKDNKGYMLVEIIVASVIAFSVAYYLLNLVYKFKDINEDVFVSTTFQNDKVLIVKNIMNDLEDYEITNISYNKNAGIIDLTTKDYEAVIEKRRIKIENKKITYGKWDETSNDFIKNDKSYYYKELNKSLEIGTVTMEQSPDNTNIRVRIPVTSIYNDRTYNINLYFKTNNKLAIDFSNINLGSYISYTPTLTSYTTDTNYTGYSTQETINPSELNIWRVIKKNEDGTIDIISKNVSSIDITFYGKTGYRNYIYYLNDVLAQQYINSAYASSARYIGYNGQTKIIPDTNFTHPAPWNCDTGESCNPTENLGGGDTSYTADSNLVNSVLGTKIANRAGTNTPASYWIASRQYFIDDADSYAWNIRYMGSDGKPYEKIPYYYEDEFISEPIKAALRPIVTLKATTKIESGIGTEADPYKLGT